MFPMVKEWCLLFFKVKNQDYTCMDNHVEEETQYDKAKIIKLNEHVRQGVRVSLVWKVVILLLSLYGIGVKSSLHLISQQNHLRTNILIKLSDIREMYRRRKNTVRPIFWPKHGLFRC